MRIAFAGTPTFALPCLKALLASSHTVCAVFTQPDRPAGRGQTIQTSPIKQLALTAGIPVYQPNSLKAADVYYKLKTLELDLIIVVAYGMLFPPDLLSLPKQGCINVHASLLPRWRGAAPIPYAIIHGDSETGVSIMKMEPGLDTGPIFAYRSCLISQEDSSGTLEKKIEKLGAALLMETLPGIETQQLIPTPQAENLASYAPKIKKSQAELKWNESSELLARKVRAFNPWPVAYAHFNLGRLNIWRAEALPAPADYPLHITPGTIIKASHKGIDVATQSTPLRLLEVQLAGSKRLSARDFINGKGRNLLSS